jgi:hypothetical protein
MGISGPKGDPGPQGPPGESPDAGFTFPPPTPASLLFHNQEPLAGTVSGIAVVGRAVNEMNVHDYLLYWGKSETQKLSPVPIAGAEVTGGDLTFHFSDFTALPEGATHLLAYARNAGGESMQPVATPVAFAPPAFNDISAGAAAGSGLFPSAAIDTMNDRLLVVTSDNAKPSLFSSDLDGTNAATVDISASQGAGSGQNPVLLVDTAGMHLLAFTTNGANSNRLSLFRCGLDGTSCAHIDASNNGQPIGVEKQAIVDSTNARIVVTALSSASSDVLMYRCALDGSGCIETNLSASVTGGAANSSSAPSPGIDTVNNKLLVAYSNQNIQPTLLVCSLDGSMCTSQDLSGPNAMMGFATVTVTQLKLMVDNVNKHLLVVATNSDQRTFPVTTSLTLYRCSLDGTSCDPQRSLPAAPTTSSYVRSDFIDVVGNRLITVAVSGQALPQLVRCTLDGELCRAVDLSGDQMPGSAIFLSAAFDEKSRQLMVAAPGGMNSKLGVFRFGL